MRSSGEAPEAVVDPRAWRRAVLALFAVAAGTNVPTPLLLVYRDRLDLSANTVTLLFGAYAVGLVPALFLGGPLSDRIGRRRVVLPFVALAGLASLVFVAAADSVALLFVARGLQGAVSGVVFSVGSAWVAELSAAAGAGAAGRRAAVAQSAGFALGPLTSGVLGEYAPGPTVLPYLLHVLLVAAGLLLALRLPETVPLGGPRRTGPKAPLVRPGSTRTLLTLLLPTAVCVYLFPSVVIAAVPLLVEVDAPPVLITGLLAGLTLGSGALAAPLQQRLGVRTAAIGTASGALGFVVAAASAGSGNPAGLLVAALLLGSGGGAALSSGLSLVSRLAEPTRRGTLSAVFFGSAYLGFAGPYLTAVSAEATRVEVPLLVLAAGVALLSLRLALAARRGTG